VAKIDPKRGVDLLQKQIKRGLALLNNRPVDENDHSSWENTTREFLIKCFGKGAENVDAFLEKSQAYMSSSETDWEEHYAESLKAQIAHLESCVEILHVERETHKEPGVRTKLSKPHSKTKNMENHHDPLKRRYQVFVSSTYDDLKEERRHVMQALLQTKCIPTGMELFPAASEDKEDLIKRVIDDCDYYIVIVAGRYGSLGSHGKSFTEMEFDYAVSSGKSVMGFYHSDADSLPVARSEKTDAGRQRLTEFVEKVKKVRSCAGWTTPEGLGSAIKTAIINAIENDPKPGWVRATGLPSADAIASLKNSIQRSETKQTQKSTWVAELFEISLKIIYREIDVSDEKNSVWKQISHKLRLSWKEIFLCLGPRLTIQRPRRTLNMYFEEQLAPLIEKAIPRQADKQVATFRCDVEDKSFERIMDTLVAQKLVKIIGTRLACWQITAKGQQKLAELRSAIPE
jgi:hypothetical protein